MEDGGLKVPTPEPVEDDAQKIQGGNGQGKSGSHPLETGLTGWLLSTAKKPVLVQPELDRFHSNIHALEKSSLRIQ